MDSKTFGEKKKKKRSPLPKQSTSQTEMSVFWAALLTAWSWPVNNLSRSFSFSGPKVCHISDLQVYGIAPNDLVSLVHRKHWSVIWPPPPAMSQMVSNGVMIKKKKDIWEIPHSCVMLTKICLSGANTDIERQYKPDLILSPVLTFCLVFFFFF